MPLDWAMTQMNLGNALSRLGRARGGDGASGGGGGGLPAALEEMTRERVPLDWALTQMNLGIALQTLGERESGTARLEEAVAAYRLALAGEDARAGAAPMGDDADQPRPRSGGARRARGGDGAPGRGGGGLGHLPDGHRIRVASREGSIRPEPP